MFPNGTSMIILSVILYKATTPNESVVSYPAGGRLIIIIITVHDSNIGVQFSNFPQAVTQQEPLATETLFLSCIITESPPCSRTGNN